MSAKEKNIKKSVENTAKRRTTYITRQRKSLSVKQWIRGLRAGTIDERIHFYYDNVKQFDELHGFKDPAKMTKIEKLQAVNQLEELIKKHHANSTQQNKTETATETSTGSDNSGK